MLLSAEIQSNDLTCKFTPGSPQNGQDCRWRKSVAPGGPPGGGDDADGPTEGAPLASLNSHLREQLRGWAQLANGAANVVAKHSSFAADVGGRDGRADSASRNGVRLVVDATPTADGVEGREAELADVALLFVN